MNSKRKSKKEMKEEKRLLELKIKYSKYITMVDEVTQFVLEKIDKNKMAFYEIETKPSFYYLAYFEEILNQISKCICGPYDSFIEASCMMFALIDCKRVFFNENKMDSTIAGLDFKINYLIAFQVALNIASKPVTYHEKDDGTFEATEHEFIEIQIPEGLIEDQILANRIINSFSLTNITKDGGNILTLSNTFHLLYLINSKTHVEEFFKKNQIILNL